MTEAYIFDAVRTPRGKGKKDGALYSVKPVQLVAGLLNALQVRNDLDTSQVDDIVLGCVTPVGDQGADIAKTAAMVAAQYWISPRLWLKGGLGFAKLSNTASGTDAELVIDNGGAALLGAGYELLSNRNFAIDLQGRFIVGSYDGINAKTSSGTVGVGLNWFK